MTADIASMPAGAALDALVAERVFKWERRHVSGNDDQMVPVPPGFPAGRVGHGVIELGESIYKLVPHYSTDIAAAWSVVEKLREIKTCKVHGKFNLEIAYHDLDQPWYVNFDLCEVDYAGSFGSTVPEAICRAALQALEAGR